MVKSITLRINYNTLVRLKSLFPSYPRESAVSYFMRLAKFIDENVKNGK